MTRPTLASFKQKALNDPEVRAEYAALSPAYALRRKLIDRRKAAGLPQEELAERLHTSKSAISSLENVNSPVSPTLTTIEAYAEAVGYRIKINFLPVSHST